MSRRKKFHDREYRAAYADSFVDTAIATQIRVLREQRGWTQERLAEEAGMKQSRICALEDANYSSWSTTTLKRLARAFDVPLRVSFGTFGELIKDMASFNRVGLERARFGDDPAFKDINERQDDLTTASGSLNLVSAADTAASLAITIADVPNRHMLRQGGFPRLAYSQGQNAA